MGPPSRTPIGSKWVFKAKLAADGMVGRFKECFVAKVYTPKQGTDYKETFAPAVKFKSICTLLAYAYNTN